MDIKNEFKRPKFIEEVIVSKRTKKLVGTLRVFPSTIKWKPARSKYFYVVRLDVLQRYLIENGQKQIW